MEEEAWRLKSKATWIKNGDANTKFFHSNANNRKNINNIWELEIEDGKIVSSSKDLKVVASYFSSPLKDLRISNISSQL